MIADDVYFPTDEAAAAAPTGVADDARGTPDEAAAAALDEAAAPETKRLRILGKRVSVSPASPSHVVPRADDAEAASATGPAIAYHAEIGAAPADDAQPATRRRWKSTPTLEEAASAPEMWPSSLLFLKSENICCRFRTESRRFEDVMDKDEVAWENPLGRGPFGTVYGGIARVVVNQAVAIKLFQSGAIQNKRTTPTQPPNKLDVHEFYNVGVARQRDVAPRFGISHLRLAWSSNASTQTSGSS